MKKILVLGSSGMAGSVVSMHLSGLGYDVTRLAGSRKVTHDTILLDLTKKVLLESFLKDNQFDIIVNCAGILKGQADSLKAQTVYLNSYLPHYLERRFSDTKTKIIHISTDCVFSGENGPYKEDSQYDGELFYDRGKALGEIKNDKDLTFRMSIIGPELKEDGSGLFHWFMKQSGPVDGFTNVLWSGITTLELSKAIAAAIEQDLVGLYHLVPDENVSKYWLLKLIKDAFSRDTVVMREESTLNNKVLLNTRTDFDYTVPSYPDMLKELALWMTGRQELYRQYLEGEE